jgi:hypothetical protein
MNIKYGDLTIIYNPEKTSLFTQLVNWINSGDERPPNNSKYIFLFEDGKICEYNNEITDYNYKFFNSSFTLLPLYFEKSENPEKKIYHTHIYFLEKNIMKKEYDNSLDFNELFDSYSKFNSMMNIESIYNCIYYYHDISSKPKIFGIIRIKSNTNMPRYQFAYDSEKFTKEEIIYLIHTIFN